MALPVRPPVRRITTYSSGPAAPDPSHPHEKGGGVGSGGGPNRQCSCGVRVDGRSIGASIPKTGGLRVEPPASNAARPLTRTRRARPPVLVLDRRLANSSSGPAGHPTVAQRRRPAEHDERRSSLWRCPHGPCTPSRLTAERPEPRRADVWRRSWKRIGFSPAGFARRVEAASQRGVVEVRAASFMNTRSSSATNRAAFGQAVEGAQHVVDHRHASHPPGLWGALAAVAHTSAERGSAACRTRHLASEGPATGLAEGRRRPRSRTGRRPAPNSPPE